MTRPKPQFSQDAQAAVRNVIATPWFGVLTRETSARSPRCTGGACARTWPVTRIRIIWKAKARMPNSPPYQEERMTGSVPCGAKIIAATTTTAVSATARTNASGMICSKT